ncbi:hypothetical protein RCKICKAPOO_123 [Rhodobacter phage RcKickapoo]|nr:hypothetical protein RCKICKAPOO_123 [Rhodobacter phage RcKickapoo]
MPFNTEKFAGDLTDNERGFIDKLQEWLDNENRKYEV